MDKRAYASSLLPAILAMLCLLVAPAAHGTVCVVPENGGGTVDLPPACPGGYAGQMAIVDGLLPGTTVQIDATLGNFTNIVRTPGGPLGGEVQNWSAILHMDMTGTGALAGYHRSVSVSVQGATHSAPRSPGLPAQTFATALFLLQGQILGDPDFDLLRVTGGGGLGLPSPGQTALTRIGGAWNVDSFFDITYRIEFVGHPSGPLSGWSGSTTDAARFQAGERVPACVLPDNGSGTVDLPPDCAHGYTGPMAIVDGLPPGTTVEIAAALYGFTNVSRAPGGSLGGEIQNWEARLRLHMTGTGTLAGFHRDEFVLVQGQTHSASRTPRQPVQSFPTTLFTMQGQITGDPDFDLLRITAGDGFGMPSPGHTTLTQVPSGWSVDSFFDITYRIDFVGHPGGWLSGWSGSTTASERFRAGEAPSSGAPDADASARGYALHGARPNPSRSVTAIEYSIPPGGGPVALEIVDVGGRVVRTLEPPTASAGTLAIRWDGRDAQGYTTPSRVYILRLRGAGIELSRPMLMLH